MTNGYTYYCPTCKRILDFTEIDSCMNTPNEIIDYCLQCKSRVINLKERDGSTMRGANPRPHTNKMRTDEVIM